MVQLVRVNLCIKRNDYSNGKSRRNLWSRKYIGWTLIVGICLFFMSSMYFNSRTKKTDRNLRNKYTDHVYPMMPIDVAVLYACKPGRLKSFFNNINVSDARSPYLRIVFIKYQCKNDDSFEIPGKYKDIIKVYGTNKSWSRANNANQLMSVARKGIAFLLLDIDIYLHDGIIESVLQNVNPGVVYFPIVWSLYSPLSLHYTRLFDIKRTIKVENHGFWRKWGFGMVAMHTDDINLVRFDEHFVTWGGEDNDFYEKVNESPLLTIVRKHDKNFIHEWHPKYCLGSGLEHTMLGRCEDAAYDYNYSPLVQTVVQKSPITTIFAIIISADDIKIYIQSRGQDWLHEMQSKFTVVFVVGNSNVTHLQKIEGFKSIYILHARANEIQYPPLDKSIELFSYDWPFEFHFLVKTDSDTYVNPQRLNMLVKHLPLHNKLYLGRWLHSCNCNKMKNEADTCNKTEGVSYNSGSFHITSSLTLFSMKHQWHTCKKKTFQLKNGFKCKSRSSDMFVGWCLGTQNISPSVWDNPFPLDSGKSWTYPVLGTRKRTMLSLACQQHGMPGGVGKNHIVGTPDLTFKKEDFLHCVSYHPLKQATDISYVKFAEYTFEHSEYLSKMPSVQYGKCDVAIGVLSAPKNRKERDNIRSTWGALAKSLPNVRILFLLGQYGIANEIYDMVNKENELKKDLLFLNGATESYKTLFTKSVRWFKWASKHTNCKYIMKVDDDVYVRMIQLLRSLSQLSLQGGIHYFGTHLWQTSKVVKDKTSQWNMDWYKPETYPPYYSGPMYGMSSFLAQYVGDTYMNLPVEVNQITVEDAAIAIIISYYPGIVKKKTFESGRYFSDVYCDDKIDVADYDNINRDFDMQKAFYSDLNGKFCEYAKNRRVIYGHSSKNNV